MQLFSLQCWRRRQESDAVAHDAATLLATWGEVAHDVAKGLSWREDAGLLQTAMPGHWGRVSDVVGARLGATQPSADRWTMAA